MGACLKRRFNPFIPRVNNISFLLTISITLLNRQAIRIREIVTTCAHVEGYCLDILRNSEKLYERKRIKALMRINTQVASGGKVPRKPGDCNSSHIPKVLEHPTGLPNLQPSHEPPVPDPLLAPVHSSQMAQWEKKCSGGNTENR